MAGLYERNQTLKIADLGDSIFIAESEKVPFSRLLKRGPRPKQMFSEWPVEKYPDRGFGGTPDGFDISEFNHTNRDKLSCYAQWIMTEGWMVSKLANLTETAAVGLKEKAHQAKRDALVLSQQIEKALLSTVDTRAEDNDGAYLSRGAFSWLAAAEQAACPVPEAYRPAAACHYTSTLANFAASNMETMLAAMATAKRAPVDLELFAGIALKAQMTSWAQRDVVASTTAQPTVSYQLSAKEKTFMRQVDFFRFDAGSVRAIPSFYVACDAATGAASAYSSRSGVLIDLAMWRLCWLQEPAGYEAPQQSGGPRGWHDAVFQLRCMNPLGQGTVLTNS